VIQGTAKGSTALRTNLTDETKENTRNYKLVTEKSTFRFVMLRRVLGISF
jgi:hypothetical protein